jgi:hypothetical protein
MKQGLRLSKSSCMILIEIEYGAFRFDLNNEMDEKVKLF